MSLGSGGQCLPAACKCPPVPTHGQPMMMWKAVAQACPSPVHPALYISPFSNRDASQMPCGIYFCFWCFVGFLVLAALRLPHGMRDRSSLTRDEAYIPYTGKWILYLPGLPRGLPMWRLGFPSPKPWYRTSSHTEDVLPGLGGYKGRKVGGGNFLSTQSMPSAV